MLRFIFRGLLLTMFGMQISACGGSDDNEKSEKYDKPYLQFYNGSADSGAVYVTVDEGNNVGSAVYGDATSVVSLEQSDVQLSFSQQASDGSSEIIGELSTNIGSGKKLLVVLSGDTTAANFSAYPIERTELVSRFRLFATSVLSTGQDYDLYLAQSGDTFADAHLLSSVSEGALTQFESWQAEDSRSFSQGDYHVYLTLPGEDTPVFESADITFQYATEYTFIIRSSAGAIKNNLELDLVINSSSVNTYAAIDQAAQFRIYNSLNDTEVSVDIVGAQDEQRALTLAANDVSEFDAIAHGDYQLTGKAPDDESFAFSNQLLSLTQGRSKAIVLYENAEQTLDALTFEESHLPQNVEHDVQVVNVTLDYSALDVFFVRQNETIATAKYRAQNLEFEHSARLTVKSGQYEIVIVHNQEDDTQLLLTRSPMLNINQNENYIVSIETSMSSPSGYEVVLLH